MTLPALSHVLPALRELVVKRSGIGAVIDAATLRTLPQLTRLVADDVSDASALPPLLRVLLLDSERLSGSEIPLLPHLQQVRLGSHVSDVGIVGLCRNVPLLESLSVAGCVALNDEPVAEALALLPHLNTLNVNACSNLSSAAVVPALLKSGARLRSLDSRNAWLIVSAEVCKVMAADMHTLKFNAPRPMLLGALGPHMTRLALAESSTLDDVSWAAVCAAAPLLRHLKLVNMVALTDERLSAALLATQGLLESLVLRNVLVDGSGLLEPARAGRLNRVRKLVLRSCCTDVAVACELFTMAFADLRTLVLESSAESDELFRVIARHQLQVSAVRHRRVVFCCVC